MLQKGVNWRSRGRGSEKYFLGASLLNFLQRCKSSINNKGLAGAHFMDLSKAFDSVDHDLLLAKFNAYGINLDALQLLRSFLSKRHQ